MTSVEEIVNIIFGGRVSIDSICSLLVAIWAVVCSVLAWRARVKAIRADNAILKKDEQIAEQQETLDELKSAIVGLSNIIVDAYLSNANVSADTKKVLATQAEQISKLADLKLSSTTEKLIDIAKDYAPDSDLIKHEETVKAEVAAAEQILDSVSDAAKDALAKLSV